MAVFEYKALNGGGRAVSGIIDADNPKSARQKLRKQGIFPTEVFESRGKKSLNLSREVDFKKYFQRVSNEDVSVMMRQLATLVGAGVPLIESLSAVASQLENEKLRLILTEVREKVNEGISLADAMRVHPTIFTDLYVNMIGAGEQSGALDKVLLQLADYAEAQEVLRGKVIGALTYPFIMAGVSTILIGLLFTFVIPKITKIFEGMKITLPLTTRILIWTSSFAVNYWYLVLLGGGALGYGTWRFFKTDTGIALYDKYVLRLPIFGRLLRMVALSRFSHTLATLLHSGVPLLNALKIVRNIVNNRVIAGAIDAARESIQEGHSIADPLKRSGEFPSLATHMIAIGERSGQLESMLFKVSDAYNQQVDRMVSTMTTLLQPVMILLMGGIVMFIALSILLPMLQITQSIR